jgi:hypothetical protein
MSLARYTLDREAQDCFGARAARRVPLNDSVLLVSGRASFESVQKALMGDQCFGGGGCAIQPGSGNGHAVRDDSGGLRTRRPFNIYLGAERIVPQE